MDWRIILLVFTLTSVLCDSRPLFDYPYAGHIASVSSDCDSRLPFKLRLLYL